jgi:hypothetical protein
VHIVLRVRAEAITSSPCLRAQGRGPNTNGHCNGHVDPLFSLRADGHRGNAVNGSLLQSLMCAM